MIIAIRGCGERGERNYCSRACVPHRSLRRIDRVINLDWKSHVPHRAAGERSNVLQRSGLRGSGGDNDRVLHGVVLLKSLDKLGDSRTLLTNGDVDTVELLGLVVAIVPALLVEHGVEGDGGLAGLTVTNDQLTLTTADGHHGVDGLETGLHGLVDGAAGENTGGLDLGTALLVGLDGSLAVDGLTEGVDDTAEEGLADRNVDLRRC